MLNGIESTEQYRISEFATGAVFLAAGLFFFDISLSTIDSGITLEKTTGDSSIPHLLLGLLFTGMSSAAVATGSSLLFASRTNNPDYRAWSK